MFERHGITSDPLALYECTVGGAEVAYENASTFPPDHRMRSAYVVVLDDHVRVG